MSNNAEDPCSTCDCETSILIGRITDNKNLPMSDVTISYADQPNTTLAISDNNGQFRVHGVCATSQKLTTNKPLFTRVEDLTTCGDNEDGANCTSYFNAQLHRIGKKNVRVKI